MNQQSLFPIDPVDPEEAESPDHHAARLAAALAFNDAYLRGYYRTHLPGIIGSQDTIRIRLFLDWWITHQAGVFYEGYPRHILVYIEPFWKWVAKLLDEQIEPIVPDDYRYAVQWHIEAVRAMLEK